MLSRSESTNLKSVRGSLNNLTSRSHGSISRSLNNLSKEKKNELLERTLGIIHAEAYKAEEVDSEIEREKEVEQEVEVEVEVATEQFNAETGEKTTVMVKQIEKKMQLVKKKFTDIERVVKRWRKDEIFKKITDHDFKVVFEQEIKLSIDAAKELFKGSAGSAHFDDLVKSVTR